MTDRCRQPTAETVALLSTHEVTCERLEPLREEWLPLLDELLGRLVACGWRHRRVAQLKEKFGTLRLHVEPGGESEDFLAWARVLAAEFRERSTTLARWRP
jgi:hypothetical protein